MSTARINKPSGTSPLRRRVDGAARWVVSGGGVTIIFAIIGILAFILIEMFPLLDSTTVTPLAATPYKGTLVAAAENEHRTLVATLDSTGLLTVKPAIGVSRPTFERALAPESGVTVVSGSISERLVSAKMSDGSLVLLPFEWKESFRGSVRESVFEPGSVQRFQFDGPIRTYDAILNKEGTIGVAAATDSTLHIARLVASENFLTAEIEFTREDSSLALSTPIAHLVMDRDHRYVYGALTDSRIGIWERTDQTLVATTVRPQDGPAPITALGLLLGNRALVVGHEDGSFRVWFRIDQGVADDSFQAIHDFPKLDAAVRRIVASPRDRSFAVVDDEGNGSLCFSTTASELWRGRLIDSSPQSLFYSPKANGLIVASKKGHVRVDLVNKHPEASFTTYFGKVWYEDYPDPTYVWQSTGGDVSFEKKLSLIPLISGTLKGTFFSLILAVPLAVLAALYASQYLHASLLRYIKPIIEIMAALPSVVLGLVAGLWLAPRIKGFLPGFLLMIIALPAAAILAGYLYERRPHRFWPKAKPGLETFLYGFAMALAGALCLALAGPLENWLFGGDIQVWLGSNFQIPYDQRNAVVIGLAMGFTVIPIVFTISEEAFASVPGPLVSGSLALGANRWQTIVRVVFPMASPGIFSAIMVGFGRAVGETMIVVMATGNTPIMDWNPFNGFRTLSANIAVEIPEAAKGDTLYRTLFLAAFILFLLTFVVNTVADVIRHRIRKRYTLL